MVMTPFWLTLLHSLGNQGTDDLVAGGDGADTGDVLPRAGDGLGSGLDSFDGGLVAFWMPFF